MATDSLASIVLKSFKDNEEIKAGSLWAQHPVVLVLLRRPGCILCRYQASELWQAIHQEAEQMGVRMVCIVHEGIKGEIEAFSPAYWPGDVYLDSSKDFFKYLGGGKLLKANLIPFFNPFSAVWRRIMMARTKVPTHNLIGTGTILGGVLVIGRTGSGNQAEVIFKHIEKDLGLPPKHDDVREAMQKAVVVAN